jgi:hypothetical protein
MSIIQRAKSQLCCTDGRGHLWLHLSTIDTYSAGRCERLLSIKRSYQCERCFVYKVVNDDVYGDGGYIEFKFGHLPGEGKL